MGGGRGSEKHFYVAVTNIITPMPIISKRALLQYITVYYIHCSIIAPKTDEELQYSDNSSLTSFEFIL